MLSCCTGSEKLLPKSAGLSKTLGPCLFTYGKIWLLKGLRPKLGFDLEVSRQTPERKWKVLKALDWIDQVSQTLCIRACDASEF